MAGKTPAPLETWGRGHPALTSDTPSLLTLPRQPALGQGSPGGLVTGVIDTGNAQAPAPLHEQEGRPGRPPAPAGPGRRLKMPKVDGCPGTGRSSGSAAANSTLALPFPIQGLPALALQAAHQVVIRLDEFFHPFVFQLLGNPVEVDAQLWQPLQDGGGLV